MRGAQDVTHGGAAVDDVDGCDGELAGFCDDDRWTAGPGSFVFVPRDRPHRFVVTSDGRPGHS